MKIFIIGGTSSSAQSEALNRQRSIVAASMKELGTDIIARGHDLLVCSPFSSSADIDAVRGAAAALRIGGASNVEFHCPDDRSVQQELETLVKELALTRFHRHLYATTVDEQGKVQWTYAWLLAQVSAMDRSDVVIALGGQAAGSASLLLELAEGRRKPVLPLTFADGAAGALFQRRQYALKDRLSDLISILHEASRVSEVVKLAEALAIDNVVSSNPPASIRIFISYPRTRPEEADFIEMTLRRRNYEVYRDERDFGAGQQVHAEIVEHIHRSTIFLAIWCKEYACSPWCYDELDIALKLSRAGSLTLWIFQVDETRIVPPDARNLLSYSARSREELQSHVLTLLEQIQRTSSK